MILSLLLVTGTAHADARRKQIAGAIMIGFAVAHLALGSMTAAMTVYMEHCPSEHCQTGLPAFSTVGLWAVGLTLSSIALPLYTQGTNELAERGPVQLTLRF